VEQQRSFWDKAFNRDEIREGNPLSATFPGCCHSNLELRNTLSQSLLYVYVCSTFSLAFTRESNEEASFLPQRVFCRRALLLHSKLDYFQCTASVYSLAQYTCLLIYCVRLLYFRRILTPQTVPMQVFLNSGVVSFCPGCQWVYGALARSPPCVGLGAVEIARLVSWMLSVIRGDISVVDFFCMIIVDLVYSVI